MQERYQARLHQAKSYQRSSFHVCLLPEIESHDTVNKAKLRDESSFHGFLSLNSPNPPSFHHTFLSLPRISPAILSIASAAYEPSGYQGVRSN